MLLPRDGAGEFVREELAEFDCELEGLLISGLSALEGGGGGLGDCGRGGGDGRASSSFSSSPLWESTGEGASIFTGGKVMFLSLRLPAGGGFIALVGT